MSRQPSEEAGTAISILTQGQFTFYTVTEHGMTFLAETPRDTWLDVMKQLCGMHEGAVMTAERTLMLLADALNFGEKAFNEEFAQAIEGTRQSLGLTPKTISNAQWAYGRIDASRRRDGLTLAHYSVIAALPPAEQDRFMDNAIEAHMTVQALKQEVADKFPKTKRGKTRTTKPKPGKETAATALAKMIDVSNWLSEHSDEVDAKWKAALEKAHLIYRRKWQSGVRKKR